MRCSSRLLILTLTLFAADCLVAGDSEALDDAPVPLQHVEPTILVAILARNSEHLLSTFFGYLEQQIYSKDRVSFWIHSDHSIDLTGELLREWAEGARGEYHSIKLTVSEEWNITDQTDPWHWSDQRFQHVSTLRQSGLDYALDAWADYILFLDTDVFLCDPHALSDLVGEGVRAVAPMLTVGFEKLFSNFWGSLSSTGYYKRSGDYVAIVMRNKIGTFRVPLIHSVVLLDLRDSLVRKLRYWPPPPGFDKTYERHEDALIFLFSAAQQGVDLYVTNKRLYGYMMYPTRFSDLDHARDYFKDFSIENLVDLPPLPLSRHLSPPTTAPPDTLGVDRILVVNLLRRPERRERMKAALALLNLEYEMLEAVDGRQLNDSYLAELGVKMLPGWRDPWGSRPITNGEIGCFLSHYFIWERVLQENLSSVIVLEDDIRFLPQFRKRFYAVAGEVRQLAADWDLVYLGRKRLVRGEPLLKGARWVVRPAYTYWTVGYMISSRGAGKLIAQDPLKRMMAVDEYLPVMFDKHPRRDWSENFSPRDLKTFSAEPLLLEPTHFVGDKEYFTDTEPFTP